MQFHNPEQPLFSPVEKQKPALPGANPNFAQPQPSLHQHGVLPKNRVLLHQEFEAPKIATFFRFPQNRYCWDSLFREFCEGGDIPDSH